MTGLRDNYCPLSKGTLLNEMNCLENRDKEIKGLGRQGAIGY